MLICNSYHISIDFVQIVSSDIVANDNLSAFSEVESWERCTNPKEHTHMKHPEETPPKSNMSNSQILPNSCVKISDNTNLKEQQACTNSVNTSTYAGKETVSFTKAWTNQQPVEKEKA